jgi:hypothetical protein
VKVVSGMFSKKKRSWYRDLEPTNRTEENHDRERK